MFKAKIFGKQRKKTLGGYADCADPGEGRILQGKSFW